MSITNGYCTLKELKRYAENTGTAKWTEADNENMELAIEAASRWIDDETQTRFYTAVETRYYTATQAGLLWVTDDMSPNSAPTELVSLKTDDDGDGVYETTWATSDYTLEPRNAPANGKPFRQIRVTHQGQYRFPATNDGVEVTTLFGYSTTAPRPIKQACLLLALRLWQRHKAIFGVSGTNALGITRVKPLDEDADIAAMIRGISRRGF